jgi:predicted MFS family arabinose efflux permease
VVRSKAALVALALNAFVVGTCELVIVGLLGRIAASMTASISTACHAVCLVDAGKAARAPGRPAGGLR